jgi:hypothetical protein
MAVGLRRIGSLIGLDRGRGGMRIDSHQRDTPKFSLLDVLEWPLEKNGEMLQTAKRARLLLKHAVLCTDHSRNPITAHQSFQNDSLSASKQDTSFPSPVLITNGTYIGREQISKG